MQHKKSNHIPVVFLCSGMGTRLAEQTEVRPKPLVEIGGQPIRRFNGSGSGHER